ncbi:MAG: Zinc ABC transporter, periplasmic-binding protein ZnuA [uncultured Sulfurovum sp.]|uniref:Zinc ABC transporter, periplasmic-binding protein ZnuA n=1 Tax=uncultured Sulfurovum sp. TaxID=269237 RepID=A0A6S6SRT2_9BACT|nr:MAG: Zinc ABC transporter, periplasmic-binding protein ZnuA [uncultured Sulfurovum sp.]
MPFEFEDKEHFLKDLTYKDIEPIVSDPKDGTHHHHHGGVDPHTWTAPSNVKIMAKNIYNTFVKLDTENASYYKENYENFLEEIEQTDKTIKEILTALPLGSQFMVFHPSWGYFAKEYGLTQLSVEVDGKEPKPKMLQRIIKEARQQGIKAIFTQQEFSDKSAKTIAHALNIKVIKETPLAKDWSENLIKKAKAIANNN